jgi:hypothetical protein
MDFTGSKLMSDSGTARAEAEIIARIAASSNLYAYGMMVSTNYIQKGFYRGKSSYTNVSYVDLNGLKLQILNDIRQNLTNLFYDPRPPVYVVTNANTGGTEFRFYHDINRNGLFDTNGWQPVYAGQQIVGTNFLWGDPEWIGVLEHPDQPHSSSNRFIGRYAFLVVPAGKTLDLNFIHNRAKRQDRQISGNEGYLRNEGVGSWEINLAAFFRDLNTNIWNLNSYTYDPRSGWAFEDAVEVLRFRYNNDFTTLKSVNTLFAGTPAPTLFQRDGIDIYSDNGPFGVKPPPEPSALSSDDTTRPWSGSDNTNGYYSIYELFDTNKISPAFVNRLRPILRTGTTYQRTTFARLMEQLGTDSLPANRDKLNLNYDNVDLAGNINPSLATNFVVWTNALRFFTNAADRMLRSQYGTQITLTNIPVWPTNFYNANVHRLLQLAANIADVTATNRFPPLVSAPGTNLLAPPVFRPLFRRTPTSIVVSGFEEVTNTVPLAERWVDLRTSSTNQISTVTDSRVNVYGIPWVVGARKGVPNFNEFHLKTSVQVTRRLEVQKMADTRFEYHQLYEIGISNFFGLEAWNSYTQAYPGTLELRVVTNQCGLLLNEDLLGPLKSAVVRTGIVTGITSNTWVGEQFRVPLSNVVVFVPDSGFYPNQSPHLQPALTATEAVRFDRTTGFPIPQWKYYATNRVVYALVDVTAPATPRIVDFVNLDNQLTTMDITKALVGATNFFGDSQGMSRLNIFWQTNRVGSGVPVGPGLAPVSATFGITNQIYASFFTNFVSDSEWTSFSLDSVAGNEKLKAIHDFRQFLGYPGLPGFTNNPVTRVGERKQVPFSPTRKMELQMSWQANDPLVHYHVEDLFDPTIADTNNIKGVKPGYPPEPSNLGLVNLRYNPWGGRPGTTVGNDPYAFNVNVKDPLVSRSDDWDFPTNKFPNLGWLGRVHRGTPWQTVYLKAGIEQPRSWTKWAGRPETHPTSDWKLLQLFTTAPNDNAARGLLSVNQTNLAAWSAVLSGVYVLSNNVAGVNKDAPPTTWSTVAIEPASRQLLTIVGNINATRLQQPGQAFRSLGDVLASPALTIQSPFLNFKDPDQLRYGISDVVYERIPQQILSLLKEDEPFVVIYSFGQALRPAERSIVTQPGIYQNLCTNYQITGEVVTKTAVRFLEIKQPNGNPSTYRSVVESYNVLPTD